MPLEQTVFVVQRPAYRAQNGSWAEKYDISGAADFGRLVDVLPPGNVPFNLAPALAACKHALRDMRSDDYLLALGDPVAIALATMIAAHYTGGRLNMLKWDRRSGRYRSYTIAIDV